MEGTQRTFAECECRSHGECGSGQSGCPWVAVSGFPTIVGPYGFFNARVYLKQTIFDYSDLEHLRAAKINEQVAQYNYKDARDLVVLAVGNAYLLALAGAARVETSEAQVKPGKRCSTKLPISSKQE